jgi:hypothetical protein
MVRKVFGQIASKDFVSVQPMSLPSGLVFFLDFQYGTAKSGSSIQCRMEMYSVLALCTVLLIPLPAPTDGTYGAGKWTYSSAMTSSANGACYSCLGFLG